MQRNWKPPAAGRTSEESLPIGPPTQLNRNQLLAETLHIARPIAHCILYKQLNNNAGLLEGQPEMLRQLERTLDHTLDPEFESHQCLLHRIVHNSILQDKNITICQQYFL